jgi:hypothetical protein
LYEGKINLFLSINQRKKKTIRKETLVVGKLDFMIKMNI